MAILICHEAGHFIQARRYHVFASYPFFLPMPIPPIGTMGAVILMDARNGDRKALFVGADSKALGFALSGALAAERQALAKEMPDLL